MPFGAWRFKSSHPHAGNRPQNEPYVAGARRPARFGVLSRGNSCAIAAPCVLDSHSASALLRRRTVSRAIPLRRFALILCAAASAAVLLSGDGLSAPVVATSEVIVTLRAPGLAIFGRSVMSARHRTYRDELAAAQAQVARNLRAAIPSVKIAWRYRIVADGFALVVPTKDVARLDSHPGHREGLAEPHLPLAFARQPDGDRRRQALGHGPRDSRPGDQDRDPRRRCRRRRIRS